MSTFNRLFKLYIGKYVLQCRVRSGMIVSSEQIEQWNDLFFQRDFVKSM